MNGEYFMRKCPHCGNGEFKVKCRIKGLCEYKVNLDGQSKSDNSNIINNLNFVVLSRCAYCSKCGKRLFKLPADFKV